MDGYYILEGHEAKKVDYMTWASSLKKKTERHVADEKVGDARVSTIFLGLDHSFGYGPPLLFETMVFGGRMDEEMCRYTTWDEAKAGHKAMVERVQNGEAK